MGMFTKDTGATGPTGATVHIKDPYQNPKDVLGVNKVPLHLIPMVAQVHEAMAMWQGGVKYDPYNWRGKKVVASIYIAAERRHTGLWYDTSQRDAKDGFHHLGHARACLGILLDAEATGNLIDDRPPPGATEAVIEAYGKVLEYTNALMAQVPGTNAQKMAAVDWAKAHAIYDDALAASGAPRADVPSHVVSDDDLVL